MPERPVLKTDRVIRIATQPVERRSGALRWSLGIAVLLLLSALAVVAWATSRESDRSRGERREHSSGRDFSAETEVQSQPQSSRSAIGWESERVWSGHDDWEPFVAADRSSDSIYQMTTRFNPVESGIFIRHSADSGATWEPDQVIAPVNKWQADPQVKVAGNGTVFAVWLDGPNWKSKLVKSLDHGKTWSTPVVIAPALPWTDHPWLVLSEDARDVYVGLNKDDSFVVVSHDGGENFAAPIRTNPHPTPGHWWNANGGAIAPDGSIYFVVINYPLNYRGPAEINLLSSHDRGASWQTLLLDTSAPPPGCHGVAGCKYGFLAATAGLAVDRSGRIAVIYQSGSDPGAPQPMWVSTSTDGVNWSPRMQVSQPNERADNGFPAIAAGPQAGDFRVVWQGDNGDPSGWNTFYRRSTDGGISWGDTVLLSDRKSGAPYKTAKGYLFPYGDYLGLSVDRAGRNHVIWAEGASYDGPGGSWYTRSQPPR